MQDSTNPDLKDTLVICHLDALLPHSNKQGTSPDSLSLAELAVQLENRGCTSVVLFINKLLTQHSFSRLKAAKTKLKEKKLTVEAIITPSDFLHRENQLPDMEENARGIKEQLGTFEWSFDQKSAFNRAEKNGSVRELENVEKNAVELAQPSSVMMTKFVSSLPEDKKNVLIISHLRADLVPDWNAASTSSRRKITTQLVSRAGVTDKKEGNQLMQKTPEQSLRAMNYPRWPGILLFVITLLGALPAITGLCCEQAAHAPDWWAECTQWVAKTLGDNALHHTLWPASLGVAGAGLFGLAIYFWYKQSSESKKRELENHAPRPTDQGVN